MVPSFVYTKRRSPRNVLSPGFIYSWYDVPRFYYRSNSHCFAHYLRIHDYVLVDSFQSRSRRTDGSITVRGPMWEEFRLMMLALSDGSKQLAHLFSGF